MSVRAVDERNWESDVIGDIQGIGANKGVRVNDRCWNIGDNNLYYCTAVADESSTWSALTGGITVLERSTTTVTIENTASKSTLFTYSIPADTLSTNKMVRVTMMGEFLNAEGTTNEYDLHLDWAGSEVWENTISSIGHDTDHAAWMAQIWVQALGSASSQWVEFFWAHNTPDTGSANTGYSHISHTVAPEAMGVGSAEGPQSADTTSAQTIAINITLDTADADYWIKKRFHIIELL